MITVQIAVRTAGNQSLSRTEDILLQGTKNMSLSTGAVPTTTATWYRLALTVSPGSILRGVRLQARIHHPQSMDTVNSRRTNLQCVFVVNVRGSGRSPDTNITGETEGGRILHEVITEDMTGEPLAFSANNYIDVYFPITATEISNEIYLFFQVSHLQWSGTWNNWTTFVTGLEIYSLSFDYETVGCGGVEVRSIDGRLISVTEGKEVTYPILFLGRDPVREDAHGWKEVLVFQDRATTLRVLPQPIVLNEENNYVSNASVESNGLWSLDEYDTGKLRCTLGSREAVTEGRGNDILRVHKADSFRTYGLYDLAMLFSTDTSEEPYISPIVLDYAVPLTVSSRGKLAEADNQLNSLLTIELTESERCAELDIVRDRYWRIVGLPDDLTISVSEGVRSTRTILCTSPSYNKLGRQSYSFIVQSGIKRVIVSVGVTVEEVFDVSDRYTFSPSSRNRYLLLGPDRDPARHYTETLYVKRRIFDGYNITGQGAQHTVTREVVGAHDVPAEFSAGDHSDTIYERVTVRYIGDAAVDRVRGDDWSDGYSVTLVFTPFMRDADNNEVPRPGGAAYNVTCYRNIELNFEITGVNSRPSVGSASWRVSKGQHYDDFVLQQGAVWLYLTSRVPPNEAFAEPVIQSAIQVRANHGFDFTGSAAVSVSGSLGYMAAPRPITFSTRGLQLHNETLTRTLTFPAYRRYRHNAARTGVESIAVSAVSVEIRFETRCPHFFRVSNIYLQCDNNWSQHHYLLTNPDAVISVLGHNGGNHLEYTAPGNAGDMLTQWHRPVATPNTHDIYTVLAQSVIPDSIPTQNFLDANSVQGGSRTITAAFKVIVYNPVFISNTLVPRMLSADTEMDIKEQETNSGTLVTSGTIPDAFELFNRDNRIDKRVSAGSSFIVELGASRMIRSWSYSVQAANTAACGFLIEGQLDGLHELDEWEPISAVHDYRTQSWYSETGDAVDIDYVTVVPRPWSRVRVTVKHFRSGTAGKVGQFQFYEGFPVLKRSSNVVTGRVNRKQLNTFDGTARYITPTQSTPYNAVGVSDGTLFPEIRMGWGSEDMGISDTGGYSGAADHWFYQLVQTLGAAQLPFATARSRLGIRLDAPISIVGMRYDTGIVEDYSQAGAVAVEVTSAVVQDEDMSTVGAYERALTVISPWRHFGTCFLPGLDTLSVHDPAVQAVLAEFDAIARFVIYGEEMPAPGETRSPVEGTIIQRADSIGHDFRLVQYREGAWVNIGQDIIFDFSTITGDVDKSELTANNGDILRQIADAWTRTWNNFHQDGGTLRDKIAFTNPQDKARLVYDLTTDTWEDIGEYSFREYRGRQYYRDAAQSNVRSIRVYVPGLADTQDIRGGSDRIRALMGEVQFFEQFPGSDITYRDIRVSGTNVPARSVKYGERVPVAATAASLTITCEGFLVSGAAVPPGRVFAQVRNVSGDTLTWTSSTDNTAINFSLEPNYTITSVTLFYRQVTGTQTNNADRMFPFFTFTVERP